MTDASYAERVDIWVETISETLERVIGEIESEDVDSELAELINVVAQKNEFSGLHRFVIQLIDVSLRNKRLVLAAAGIVAPCLEELNKGRKTP